MQLEFQSAGVLLNYESILFLVKGEKRGFGKIYYDKPERSVEYKENAQRHPGGTWRMQKKIPWQSKWVLDNFTDYNLPFIST